nr:hypothetical protein [Tanacetum cinerariifolium]
MSLDDLYNHLKVYEAEVQKKHNSNSQDMAFISSSKNNNNEDGNTSNGSQIKFEDINQIDEDDMEEIDIKWNMTLLSMRADKAPRSQERGRRESYRQGSKAKEKSSKALMAIDGIGWDWSYRTNKEDHALVADGETPTEFGLMADVVVYLWVQRFRGEVKKKRLLLTDVITPLVEPLSSKSLTSEANISAAPIITLSTTFASSDVVLPSSVVSDQVLDAKP